MNQTRRDFLKLSGLSAAGALASKLGLSTEPREGIVTIKSGYDDLDTLTEASWNVVLTDAEIVALAAGISPLFIRPQNLIAYSPPVCSDNQRSPLMSMNWEIVEPGGGMREC